MAEINNKLRVVYGDSGLGVHGSRMSVETQEEFHYFFSYPQGGLESMVIGGKEWLYRSPRPTFWRATTDNDRGNKFHIRSGMWMSADLFMKCTPISLLVDGEDVKTCIPPYNNMYGGDTYHDEIAITFLYETITTPSTNVFITYNVKSDGKMIVHVKYEGRKDLPELPVFGMRFVMPTKASGYRYQGLSGETYPDRKAGGISGIYDVFGLPVTPYLVPQECGMHMDTDWVEIYRDSAASNVKQEQKTSTLKISSDHAKFAFSCLPYTAEELENATHQEELPPERRTVLCILGAVRGVGGIDSWGSDVEPAYRISGEEDIEYSFVIN